LDRSLVHAGSVVVADFLNCRRSLDSAPACLLEDLLQLGEGLILQLRIRAPARTVGWDRVLLQPTAAGIGIEIRTRIDALVHGAEIEHGGFGGARARGSDPEQ